MTRESQEGFIVLIAEITAIAIGVIVVVTALFDALGRLQPASGPTLFKSRGNASVDDGN